MAMSQIRSPGHTESSILQLSCIPETYRGSDCAKNETVLKTSVCNRAFSAHSSKLTFSNSTPCISSEWGQCCGSPRTLWASHQHAVVMWTFLPQGLRSPPFAAWSLFVVTQPTHPVLHGNVPEFPRWNFGFIHCFICFLVLFCIFTS